MADDTDIKDVDDEGEGAEKKGPFAVVDGQCKKQLLFGLLLLVSNFVLFGGGVISMASLYQEILARESELPFNKADDLLIRIEGGQGIVSSQYSKYTGRMEDKLISDIYTSYGTMYDVTKESENEYREALLVYKDTIYSVARNVRGSGVWFEFYSKDLLSFVRKSEQRSKQLDKYGVPDQ